MTWLKVLAGSRLIGEVESDGVRVCAADPALSFAVRWPLERLMAYCAERQWRVSAKVMPEDVAQRLEARGVQALERSAVDFSMVVRRAAWARRRRD